MINYQNKMKVVLSTKSKKIVHKNIPTNRKKRKLKTKIKKKD